MTSRAAREWAQGLPHSRAGEIAFDAGASEPLKMLKRLEWKRESPVTGSRSCPECYRAEQEGHAADCDYAKLLEEYGT